VLTELGNRLDSTWPGPKASVRPYAPFNAIRSIFLEGTIKRAVVWRARQFPARSDSLSRMSLSGYGREVESSSRNLGTTEVVPKPHRLITCPL